MVGFGGRIFNIANENLMTTKRVLEIIGSNENLQLRTMGTPIPLFSVIDPKSFVFFNEVFGHPGGLRAPPGSNAPGRW